MRTSAPFESNGSWTHHQGECSQWLPARHWVFTLLLLTQCAAFCSACSSSGTGDNSQVPGTHTSAGAPSKDPSLDASVPTGSDGGVWSDLESAAPAHTAATVENTGTVTRGGTMTFTNIGAPGYWGRRIEATPGDARCDVQSETLEYSWGGSEFCCRTKHVVSSDRLTPFNEQIALVLDGPLRIKQLAVYQPLNSSLDAWGLRSYWDRNAWDVPFNMHFVGPDNATTFDGLLGNNCSYHATQRRPFPCGKGSDPYCPGSNEDYEGWAGSKLFVLLASMPYADDTELRSRSCISAGQDERAEDSPWIGLGASELVRDGWAGYHPCHCFANTNAGVGDGCGQINVFEVVAESSGAQWGNRDVISTGIRSYQVGSLGGSTCGIQGCSVDHFAADADLIDANHLLEMTHGAVIDADHRASSEGPMWRRARDDRYYLIALDETTRTVQVAVVHPARIPDTLAPLLPALPNQVSRSVIDQLIQLRLPAN